MLIKVKGEGHNIVVPLPNAMLFNPLTAVIIARSAQSKTKQALKASGKLDDTALGEIADELTEELAVPEAAIHIEKATAKGRSEFRLKLGGKNEDFPFTEKQLSDIFRELRKGAKTLNGLPLVEVVSSDGENVEVWL